MEIKGYYTAYSYWGWTGSKYMQFATEEEYLDYILEVEK